MRESDDLPKSSGTIREFKSIVLARRTLLEQTLLIYLAVSKDRNVTFCMSSSCSVTRSRKCLKAFITAWLLTSISVMLTQREARERPLTQYHIL